MKKWRMFFILATWLPMLFAESCSDIPKVDNSIAVFWCADEGKQVTYTCSDGYHLFGEKTLYCASSGEWHAPAPICKAMRSRTSEAGTEDEENEALVTEEIIRSISAAVRSPHLSASVCEDVRKLTESLRKLTESLSCGMNLIEIKTMMEVEKLRLEKLKFQQEGWQGTN